MLLCAEKFIAELKSKGMTPDIREPEEGVVIVEVGHAGKEILSIFRGDEGEYLSVSIVYESVPAEKKTAAVLACNDINAEYKWIKAYVDSENDLIYKLDAKLSPETAAEETLEMVLRMASITDDVKPQIMKAIYA